MIGFVGLLLPPTAAATKGRSPARPGETELGYPGEIRRQGPKLEIWHPNPSQSLRPGQRTCKAFSPPTAPPVVPSTGTHKIEERTSSLSRGAEGRPDLSSCPEDVQIPLPRAAALHTISFTASSKKPLSIPSPGLAKPTTPFC